MADFNYNDNGISFKFKNEQTTEYVRKHTLGENNFEYAEELGIQPFVNAVEIDWNGAQLRNAGEINTTGQLLYAVDETAGDLNETLSYAQIIHNNLMVLIDKVTYQPHDEEHATQI